MDPQNSMLGEISGLPRRIHHLFIVCMSIVGATGWLFVSNTSLISFLARKTRQFTTRAAPL